MASEEELGAQELGVKKGPVQLQSTSTFTGNDNTIGFPDSQPIDESLKPGSQSVTASPSDLVRTISAGINPTATE